MIGGSMLKKLSDVLTRTVFTSARRSVWLREMPTNFLALGQDEKQKQSCGTQPTTTMPVF